VFPRYDIQVHPLPSVIKESIPDIQYYTAAQVQSHGLGSLSKGCPAESGDSNPSNARSAGEKVLSPKTSTSAYKSNVEDSRECRLGLRHISPLPECEDSVPSCDGSVLDPLLYVCNTRRQAEKEEAENCHLKARQGGRGVEL
jgi:hypothetical protein